MSSIKEAFVTLATNDRYAYGAIVLGQSLRNTSTSRDLVIIITPSVTALIRGLLARVFTRIIQVDPVDSHDAAHLALMSRPELGTTFTKLHCWNLLEYSKCVFLDADTLVMQNVDDLFERPELSAASDVGWPDCFNSGVFVFEPSSKTFSELLDMAVTKGSFDGADQGLLNQYFSSWATDDASHRLSFLYNMAASTTYTYLPAFLHYGKDVKIVHFLGSPVKPWDHTYNADTDEVTLQPGSSGPAASFTMPYLKQWWRIYRHYIEPMVKETLGGAAVGSDPVTSQSVLALPHVISRHTMASSSSQGGAPDNVQFEDPSPPDAWDYGQVDYTGRDRFENIQKHLDSMMQKSNDK
ncbi:glycogenin-1-like isoform X2 [Convolutriloba macropyga]|uniref:glycogenin-1-like isoform X2 n=1 Tax=Convolutriloba macropyga TaxID=536237 RepID=UPI003F51DC84